MRRHLLAFYKVAKWCDNAPLNFEVQHVYDRFELKKYCHVTNWVMKDGKKIDRNKNSGIFHPGLLTAVHESRILDLYSLLREMMRCDPWLLVRAESLIYTLFDFTKGDDELWFPPWLIPPNAQNEISYTLVDCVLQIQDNVMTTMKVTL